MKSGRIGAASGAESRQSVCTLHRRGRVLISFVYGDREMKIGLSRRIYTGYSWECGFAPHSRDEKSETRYG